MTTPRHAASPGRTTRHKPQSAARHAHPRAHRRPIALWAAATTIAVAGAVGIAPGSVGASSPVSQATGQFLSGTALSTDLATLVAVQGAAATNAGAPATVENAHPLDVTAVSAINVPLGPGLQLFGGLNPILDIGAANQYARANDDGSSHGASGAVTDQGAISIGGPTPGPQGDLSINLNTVTSSLGLGSALSNAQIGVGASAGTATQTASGVQSGTYQIAGVGLDLSSPLVANVKGQLTTVVSGVQSLLDNLTTTLAAVLCPGSPPLPCLLAVTPPNLQTTLDALTTISLAGGALTVDLGTGAIHVSVDAFLAFHGVDINALAPNTDLTALLHTLLAGDLTTGLTSTLQTLVTTLTAAVNTTTITLAGVPISAGQLLAALGPIITQLTSGVQTIIDGLVPNVLDPLLGAVDQLAQITVNKQVTAGGTFTETALAISVVAATPVATVDLASASVGPNAGPTPTPPPTASGINPNQGPVAGGQTVTLTGTNFVPGATTVSIGGNAIAANQVTVAPSGNSLTFVTPAHAAGPVTVTATTAGGTTGALGYTYVLSAPVITSPPNGAIVLPAATISGTGFPGATVTVTEGGSTLCTAVVNPSGDWTCTPTTPLTAGDHTITATQTSGSATSPVSAPVSFTVAPVPTATALDPDHGPTTGGQTVTVSGSGFIPGHTTVTIGGKVVAANQVTVTSNGTSLTFVTPPHASGAVSVAVTTPGGTSGPLTYTYVPGAAGPAGPTVSSLTPDQGLETGGTSVTVTGSNFVPGATTLTIGGTVVPADAITVSPDHTKLTFLTPPHAVGPVQVFVSTPAGTSTGLAYTYLPAPPVITSPNDNEVTGSHPLIVGTGTPRDTVTVTDAAGNFVCTGVVDSSARWQCTSTRSFDGPTKIIATQTDPIGLTSGPSNPVHLSTALPATGAEAWLTAVFGMCSLMLGACFVVLASRRRRDPVEIGETV